MEYQSDSDLDDEPTNDLDDKSADNNADLVDSLKGSINDFEETYMDFNEFLLNENKTFPNKKNVKEKSDDIDVDSCEGPRNEVDDIQMDCSPSLHITDQQTLHDILEKANKAEETERNSQEYFHAESSPVIRLNPNGPTHIYDGVDKILGKGETSIVVEGYHEVPEKRAAVKLLDTQFYELYINEINILRQLDHKNIIRYFCCSYDHNPWEDLKRNKRFYFISMELATPTLEQYIFDQATRKDEKTLIKYLRGACEGLTWLHDKNVIHRDIKPSNILISCNETAKLVDFGISRIIPTESSTHFMDGRREWVSPEELQAHERCAKFEISCYQDVYSMGVTMYFVMTLGRYLFSKTNRTSFQNPQLDTLMSNLTEVGYLLHDLLKSMLEKDYQKRPRMKDVLWHPLFWSSKTNLEFLTFVANSISAEDSSTLKLEQEFKKVLPEEKRKTWDWIGKLSSNAQGLFNNKLCRKKYEPKFVLSLIEFIRDKDQHSREWPAEMKSESEFGMGAKRNETYVSYFTKRYPELVTFLYNFFKPPSIHIRFDKLHAFYEEIANDQF